LKALFAPLVSAQKVLVIFRRHRFRFGRHDQDQQLGYLAKSKAEGDVIGPKPYQLIQLESALRSTGIGAKSAGHL